MKRNSFQILDSRFQSKTAVLFFIFLLGPDIWYLTSVFASPQIKLNEIVWNFGEISEGTTQHHQFFVKNTGNETLKVNVRSTCDCLTVIPDNFSLLPDTTGQIEITFFTEGYGGKFTKYIYLDSNDPENPWVGFVVRGRVRREQKAEGSEQRAESRKQRTENSGQRSAEIAVPVTIFDSRNCGFCLRLRQKIIPALESKYKIVIPIQKYYIDEPRNYERLIMLEKKFAKRAKGIPVVFIGEDMLGGEKEIKVLLSAVIEKYIQAGGAEPITIEPLAKKKIEEEILARFRTFQILPILLAGLADGVNPCAFATIVFLITYLSVILKRSRSEILLTGVSFVSGVGLAYFLLGLGLARVIKFIGGLNIISRVIYIFLGILTLILAIYNFKDYLMVKQIQRGEKGQVTLGLPRFIRRQIDRIVVRQAGVKYFWIFAFVTGVVISLLELFCTGQIYFPTIMYITAVKGIKFQPVFYLLLYVLMFVIPLIIIFCLFYFGIGSEKLGFLKRQSVSSVKLFTGIVLLVLSAAMFLISARLF